MPEPDSKSASDAQPVALRSPGEVIAASAKEALGGAFLVWILGGVALSIAGSFAGQMIPSLPPGLAGPGETHHAGHPDAWWNAVRGDAFVLFFAIFFAHSLWVGFHRGGGEAGGRVRRILSRLRRNWFGLIVGNAISAWVAVLVLGIMQNFSPWQMLWHAVWAMLLPILNEIGRFVFGPDSSASMGRWFTWYDANQMKLNFWIIYLGGAFDDLGVPNLKSLARWGWRRTRKRKEAALPAVVDQRDLV